MRKILSQEEIEQRTKRRGRILTLLMLLILLGSTAGYAVLSSTRDNGSGSGNSNTNGTQTQTSDGRWALTYQGQQLIMINSKQSVENISVSTINKASDYFGKKVYVSSNNKGEYNEVSSTLGLVSSTMQEACYGKCDLDLPEKNCTDNLIVINQSALDGKVYQQDNCIFIDGDLGSVDAFLYKMFS